MSNVKKVNINNCIGVRTLQLLFACLAIFWGGLPVYAAGVTIITHGWNPSSGAPVWLESMRDAIAEKHLAGEKSYGKITVTKQEGSLIAACAPWDFDAATGSTGEIIVVLDWSAVANHLLGGPSVQDIADFFTRLSSTPRRQFTKCDICRQLHADRRVSGRHPDIRRHKP